MRFIPNVTILIIFLGLSPLISSAGELALFKESITEEGARHPFYDSCSGIFYVKLYTIFVTTLVREFIL